MSKLENTDEGKLSEDTEIMAFVYAALDTCTSGIVISDARMPDHPVIYINKAFENISGYTAAEVIGRNCRFLQGTDRQQAGRHKLREAIATGEDVTVEIKNYTKEGRHFWNHLHISPIRNKAKEITHFIGVQIDITNDKDQEEKVAIASVAAEREIAKRAENLVISENYFRTIIDTIGESLLVFDHDFQIVTVNEAFLQTFKLAESELLHKKISDIPTFKNIPIEETLKRFLAKDDIIKNITIEHTFDGLGYKMLKINARRVNLDGLFKGRLLIVIDDVTEKNVNEQRKDDFLAIASHELKTPLTVIKAYLQLIRKMQRNENGMIDMLDKSFLQVQRLDNLVGELLDVSKIQSGKLRIYQQQFDVDKMISETVTQFINGCNTHSVTIYGHTGIHLKGDEIQLAQVIVNLLNNAVKFSPTQHSIDLHLSNLKNHIKISVKDHGIGIPISEQQKIFERFYRVDETQISYPGMGMGLYISENIVKQHGGFIWVDSEPDQGCTVSFILPLIHE